MFNILQSDRLKKCTITFIVITILFSIFPIQTEAFSPQVIQRGATGDDVIELQSRLQYVGYYKGKIDGVFGWGTYWAVRNYQNDYGLGIDGLVGTEMKRKLEKTTEYDKAYVYGKIEQGKKFDTYGKTGRGPQPDWPPPGQRDSGNRQSPKKDQQPQGQAPGTGFQGYAKQQGTPGAGGAGTPPPGTPEPGGAGSPPAGTPEGAG
ncbi:peptidoglycan-binding protein, partial [Caldalkalibacillus mannanilyticus]|uniref:peptidoglycan-binding protein n=1 Tax=Caldalkalibacillus mannanilyticus TaxID=1418 RepID=UPI0018FFE47F